MKNLALTLLASLLFIAPVRSADPPAKGTETVREKLIGGWVGGPCEGTWIYRADGTFHAHSYTPGGNRVDGTWELKLDAQPPVLVRTSKSSDNPDLVGKTWTVKLVQLDEKEVACLFDGGYPPSKFTRLAAEKVAKDEAFEAARAAELATLQGTWVPLEYEEHGEKGNAAATRHIIKGDRITVEVGGRTQDTGLIVIDATKSPKQLFLHMHSGHSHVISYVRAGNHVIYCGRRDSESPPIEFGSGGAPRQGDYLMAWRIEKTDK